MNQPRHRVTIDPLLESSDGRVTGILIDYSMGYS